MPEYEEINGLRAIVNGPSDPPPPQVQLPQLTGSARATKAGAHHGTDSVVLQITTRNPHVVSAETLCNQTMTCPCRACTLVRGQLVNKAAAAAAAAAARRAA